MIKKLWPHFDQINRILDTYSKDDKVINKVKFHLQFIIKCLFNKDENTHCPCKEECNF